LAVLADEQATWRPDRFGFSRLGCVLDFRFPVVKLLDYAERWQELEQHPNPFATFALAHLKTQETRHAPQARLEWKSRLVKRLYERSLTAQDVNKLFRFVDWLMDLPEALTGLFWQDITQFQEERRMPFITTPERVGFRRGLEEGIAQLVEFKFGPEGLQLMPLVRQIAETETLRSVYDHIKQSETVEALRQRLATLPPSAEDLPSGGSEPT
jgi:hypothetical protein